MKISTVKLSFCVLLFALFYADVVHAQSDVASGASSNEISAQETSPPANNQDSVIGQATTTTEPAVATTTEQPQVTTTTEPPAVTTTTEPPVATTTTNQPPVATTTTTAPPVATTTTSPDATTTQAPTTSAIASSTGTPAVSSTTASDVTSSASQMTTSTPAATSSQHHSVTSASSSAATPTTSNSSDNDGGSSNKTGVIAGSVVGGVVGLALIGGFLAWLNRHGGCASRSKTNKNGFSHDDYTIDMSQNDFAKTGGAAAAGAAVVGTGAALANHNSTEPLSPFDNGRRYVPPTTNYETYAGDYHDVYSQGGYSQEGYSQEYNNAGYPPQAGEYNNAGYPPQGEYGYYDNNNAAAYAGGAAAGYDSARHEYNNYPDYQQKHYANDIMSPTSAGNMSETAAGYHPSVDKPNVKDYDSKPNEM